jgi:hypothetical protein
MSHYLPESRVAVSPFTRHSEGGEVVIGRPEAAIFLALPPDSLDILDQLAEGKTVGEVQALYRETHGEELDLDDFLRSLEQEGFVSPLQDTSQPSRAAAPRIRFHFTGIPESLARRIFSKPLLAFYGSTIFLAVAILVSHPTLLPDWRALFFTQDITIAFISLTLLGFVSVFLHEMAHLVAARALGIPSRLGIGNRLWILVAETDMTGLWDVAPSRRYLPFLAGPLMDAFCASLLVLTCFAQHSGWFSLPPFVAALLKAQLLGYLMSLLWQCYFFVRTDFYYVVANFFGCKNLMDDTATFVTNQVSRLFPNVKKKDQSHLPPRELRAIRWYSGFWLVGRVIALGVLFTLSLPLIWHYLLLMFSPATLGASTDARMELVWTSLLRFAPQLAGMWLWLRSFYKPQEE